MEWPVTSFLDDGSAGTLRSVIAASTTKSGDAITLTGLPAQCTVIRLNGTQLNVQQDSLSVVDRAARPTPIAIDAHGQSRVLQFNGLGTVTLDHVNVMNGKTSGPTQAMGGCIYAGANVVLVHSTVSGCLAENTSGGASGGGIMTGGIVLMEYASVFGNTVKSGSTGNDLASGGGIYAEGGLVMQSSRLPEIKPSPATVTVQAQRWRRPSESRVHPSKTMSRRATAAVC